MNPQTELDLVVYGASGYTGKLVAEHLLQRRGIGRRLRWGIAGRSPDKLEMVKRELGASDMLPTLVADATTPGSLQAMVARTKLVVSTVGPYQLYGTELVAACARLGKDYVDLCGEPLWMREMIDRYGEDARRTGARILFSCGFDSIPFELGVHALQTCSQEVFGKPATQVKARLDGARMAKSGFSDGTITSLRENLRVAADNPDLLTSLRDPFLLAPGFRGASQAEMELPRFDEELRVWLAPFVMTIINAKNVHRSNRLMGLPWGTDFCYDEMLVMGPNSGGKLAAEGLVEAMKQLLSVKAGEQPPGTGPTREQREAGSYQAIFSAKVDGTPLRFAVTGAGDPGYGSTSKMIAETALCLIDDARTPAGGIWTPGAALGQRLMIRLAQYAGLTIERLA